MEGRGNRQRVMGGVSDTAEGESWCDRNVGGGEGVGCGGGLWLFVHLGMVKFPF